MNTESPAVNLTRNTTERSVEKRPLEHSEDSMLLCKRVRYEEKIEEDEDLPDYEEMCPDEASRSEEEVSREDQVPEERDPSLHDEQVDGDLEEEEAARKESLERRVEDFIRTIRVEVMLNSIVL